MPPDLQSRGHKNVDADLANDHIIMIFYIYFHEIVQISRIHNLSMAA